MAIREALALRAISCGPSGSNFTGKTAE